MPERDPTLEQPGQAEGRAACSNCRRVLIFSGEAPRFCGYCGSPLDPSAVTESDPSRTTPFGSADETTDYISSRPRQAEEPFPEQVAGYRLVRRLGSGGMGTVFEAVEERQGLHVALKLIAPRNLGSHEALERFRQEGRTASAVTHPRCVFVLAVDEEAGLPYLVMELMPGTTLQSHVEENGPLAPAEAIGRILDVIEGLAEFHKLGMIHRDVKPSNCFLDHDHRVKIGDFGLSKALDGGADLTRTGAFLGTPLYASPEQIKREPLDERTDVYSVAATLYYLLSGRAPVQAQDAAEALARIASEPAPPLHDYAPKISRSLEAVIHKGLERDRSRRWRDLREFHEALLPFVPERVDIGSIGLRIGAYAIDAILYYVGVWAGVAAVFLYNRGGVMQTYAFGERHGRVIEMVDALAWVAYFVVLESFLAASIGKWFLGLRIARAADSEPPGVGRVLARTLAFVLLTGLGTEVFDAFRPPDPRASDNLRTALVLGLNAVGCLLVFAPMRPGSGLRGLHELLSGTRVVCVVRARGLRRLADRRRRGPATGRRPEAVASHVDPSDSQLGPYRVEGPVATADGCEVVSGRDGSLDRQVWLVLRDPGTPAPEAPRRGLNRLTRPRWVGGGEQPQARWDAFIAPTGRPLREVVEDGGLPWRDVLPILTDLAEELEAARGDGTFPARLSLDHVWVQPDGRVQLADPLAWDRSEPDPGDEETRAFAFLRDVAQLALEGGRTHRRLSLAGWGIPELPTRGWSRGTVPERAGVMLDRLTGRLQPYPRLTDLRSDLAAAAERPTEVGTARRGLQLLIHAFLISPALLVLAGLSCPEMDAYDMPWEPEVFLAIPFAWVVWGALMRGGVSFPLAGLTLVGIDGRLAARWRCGLRSFLVWALPTVLFIGSQWLQDYAPDAIAPAWALWFGGVLLLGVYFALGLLFLARGPHDRLSGTAVVPI
ncbi:protein kinase domain-containing protein [Paludisphaera rhizosphaerae]|uniref:protein kinase domain-containing protein n=1 Tax=Paludisphaera rhizosphaerae TaxID=2711216 RepID=UPI0013EC4631|nr:protein kinase [Paludisphaera rhizosphaerae]